MTTDSDSKDRHVPSKIHSQKGFTPLSRAAFHKRRRLVRVPQNDEEIEMAKKLDYVVWIEDKLNILPCTIHALKIQPRLPSYKLAK